MVTLMGKILGTIAVIKMESMRVITMVILMVKIKVILMGIRMV
jgi:hypothetical protein